MRCRKNFQITIAPDTTCPFVNLVWEPGDCNIIVAPATLSCQYSPPNTITYDAVTGDGMNLGLAQAANNSSLALSTTAPMIVSLDINIVVGPAPFNVLGNITISTDNLGVLFSVDNSVWSVGNNHFEFLLPILTADVLHVTPSAFEFTSFDEATWHFDCTITCVEAFNWNDLVWNDPPTTEVFGADGQYNGDDWSCQTVISADGDPSTVDNQAHFELPRDILAVTHCRLTVTITQYDGDPAHSNCPIRIVQDAVDVLNINLRNDTPAVPGVYQFNFDLQPAMSSVITVENAGCQSFFPDSAIQYSAVLSII